MPTEKKKSKSKLLELDIVRAIAIVAVVTIHATADATVDPLLVSESSKTFYIAVNKLSNFAVPVFIFISGLVLFYRYLDDWNGRQTVQFYVKRVRQALVPYLIWSLFYYLYNQWIYEHDTLHMDWREFAEKLPWADTSYHLYFMVIIVQFYLVFPLLMSLCQALPWFRKALFPLGILIQAAFYAYNHWAQPVQQSASICFNYFSIFAFGGALGLHYDAFFRWLRKNIPWVLPVTAVLGFTFMALFAFEDRLHIVLDNTWFELLFFGYAMFAGMSFIWLGRLLLDKLPSAAKALNALGAASFGIYFVHPAVLSYFKTHVTNDTGSTLHYFGYVAAGFLITLFVSWALAYAYGRFMRLFVKRRPKPATRTA
ncbi:acyltransferase [Paenibacillus filicis]|uniref:Acyltransferase n=1 Tax=Paenibacillus gyeongsangnamensis TaxID=3388067 RepID=A0ABT4Q981_9BACL|nr:acyltransferase [Paenibacillus filicis]MCZ8513435.1 acyltransferase [Paenibacillus filicis]